MAEELNLTYTLHPIGPRTGETKTERYTNLNPKQKIPLLKQDNFVLSETLGVCPIMLAKFLLFVFNILQHQVGWSAMFNIFFIVNSCTLTRSPL